MWSSQLGRRKTLHLVGDKIIVPFIPKWWPKIIAKLVDRISGILFMAVNLYNSQFKFNTIYLKNIPPIMNKLSSEVIKNVFHA